MNNRNQIPFALFNSKALFNPYQYKPFFEVMEKSDVSYGWNGNNLFITDEVGVGKTFEAGIILQELIKNNNNLSVLVICPVKLCENWEDEMKENFYLSFNNYRESKSFGQFNIVPYSYFRVNKNDAKEIETETEIQREVSDIISKELEEKIDNLKYDLLILDEAHYIRNRGSLHSCIDRLIRQNEQTGKNKLKIFMTATPIFNSEEDYDNITELLKVNEQSFKTTITLQGEANCYDFMLNIQNVKGDNELDGVDLNEQEQNIIDEIYSTYTEINDLGYDIEKTKYSHLTGFLKRISASSLYSLKQFVNKNAHFDDENYEYEDFEDENLKSLCEDWEKENDSKFNCLEGLLGALKENSQSIKVIIFSCFLDTCTYLERRLKSKYNVFTITGSDSPKKVQQAKKSFKKVKDDAVLICSDAAKEGHNLQFCHYIIHYDFPFTPAALGQRNGRIYRKGQEEVPQVYYMPVNSTYDERLFGEIIVNKSNIVKDMSGQNKISILNVLPNDSQYYIKKCLRTYFAELVTERKYDWLSNEKNKGENQPNFEQQEFKLQLIKKFSQMKTSKGDDKGGEKRERIWCSEEFKKLYENNEEIDYIEKFSEIFGSSVDNQNTKSLLEYYKNQYRNEMNVITEKIFGKDKNFVQECNNIVGIYLNENEKHRFCHDMIDNSEISIGDYKAQFKPLILLKTEKGE